MPKKNTYIKMSFKNTGNIIHAFQLYIFRMHIWLHHSFQLINSICNSKKGLLCFFTKVFKALTEICLTSTMLWKWLDYLGSISVLFRFPNTPCNYYFTRIICIYSVQHSSSIIKSEVPSKNPYEKILFKHIHCIVCS